MAKIRIFVERDSIKLGDVFALEEKQTHYLLNVMKKTLGDSFLCFNGADGEFEAKIAKTAKKYAEVEIVKKTKDFIPCDDVWLIFAPIKKDRTDFVIEKATELGATKIIPVITKHTISDKTKTQRFVLQAIEASEQSRRIDIPQIDDAISFKNLLKDWDPSRCLYYMDETGNGEPISKAFANSQKPAAILVGPEGGFCKEELDFLSKMSYTKGVSLGKLILRAETAVVAALSCWQAISGNWE